MNREVEHSQQVSEGWWPGEALVFRAGVLGEKKASWESKEVTNLSENH